MLNFVSFARHIPRVQSCTSEIIPFGWRISIFRSKYPAGIFTQPSSSTSKYFASASTRSSASFVVRTKNPPRLMSVSPSVLP